MKKVLFIATMILLLNGCSLSSNQTITEDNSKSTPSSTANTESINPMVSPSELPNKHESDNNLDNLQKQGLKVIEEQSFGIDLENWGSVRFIAGETQINGIPKLRFYLLDSNDNVLCSLPEFYGNMWIPYEVRAISFKDANLDGLKDIVIVADCILGHGENAAVPFPVGSIYFQKDREFVNSPELDNEINEEKQNENIDMIVMFAKGKDISFN